MKSAYELAMERLNRTAPQKKLTEEQKSRIAEIDNLYKSKIAEREVTLQDEIAQALGRGDITGADQLKAQLAQERKKLEAEAEDRKDKVRG